MEDYTREQELIDMADEEGRILIECASSFVLSMQYNIIKHTLSVRIQIRYRSSEYSHQDYTYTDVPFEEFVSFVNSNSKGSYYNSRIKSGAYLHENLRDHRPV